MVTWRALSIKPGDTFGLAHSSCFSAWERCLKRRFCVKDRHYEIRLKFDGLPEICLFMPKIDQLLNSFAVV